MPKMCRPIPFLTDAIGLSLVSFPAGIRLARGPSTISRIEGRKEMATCDSCGSTILFGGIKENGMRFCNNDCRRNGSLLILSKQIPKNIVDEQANKIHRGLCPKCQGNGPIDVHTSYRIYSALVYTSWKNTPHVCCRSCGVRRQLGDLVFSSVLGWWGFPWGIIMTPMQIFRNLAGMLKGPDETRPSARLEDAVRISLAAQVAENRKTTP